MPPSDNNSRIEELKKDLYSRSAPDVRTRRKLRFSERESGVQTAWERPPEEPFNPVLNTKYEDHSMSFFTKIFIGSAIFCAIAVGLGAYLFFNGANLISANNIDIQISGPVSIPGGEPVAFDIRVANKNNVDLQTADLSIDFPAGTTDPRDPVRELKEYRELIGDIPAGRTAEKTVQAIIFGEENLQKQIAVTVTYSVKGSTSVFTKTKTYDVLINSSPINVSVSSVKETASGQEFELSVKLKSNSEQTLKNVLLKGTYPFGYTFVSSSIKPTGDNATWRIGDIPPGGERTVSIKGKLAGEDSELRVFRFMAGAQSAAAPNAIGTEYMSIEQHISIEKPFISLGVVLDGDESTGDFVGSFGRPMRAEVRWFNNLSVPVSNAQISVKLAGNAYEKSEVRPDQGVFRSATDEIVWNQQTNPELRTVEAGDSGVVTFMITPRDKGTAASPVVNPSISISASVSGNRLQESRVPESLSAAAARNVRVASNVSLTGRVVRSTGPFMNTGPIPPRVEQATTYTVIWTVDNTSSAVTNARVTATLPAHVKWLGAVSPSAESVSYDTNSGEIAWDIGNVSTYTAGSSRRREVAFQISIEPGADQAEQTLTLVNQARLSAIDSFTGVDLQSSQEPLSTRFSTDPVYKEGDESVRR